MITATVTVVTQQWEYTSFVASTNQITFHTLMSVYMPSFYGLFHISLH